MKLKCLSMQVNLISVLRAVSPQPKVVSTDPPGVKIENLKSGKVLLIWKGSRPGKAFYKWITQFTPLFRPLAYSKQLYSIVLQLINKGRFMLYSDMNPKQCDLSASVFYLVISVFYLRVSTCFSYVHELNY